MSCKGSEDKVRDFLLNLGLWAQKLHNEIWVFNQVDYIRALARASTETEHYFQGFWSKDAALWRDVQKASWADVILEEEFKKALKKDVYGFFEAEKLYKDLGLPWKVVLSFTLWCKCVLTMRQRGLILYGPPGEHGHLGWVNIRLTRHLQETGRPSASKPS